MKVINVLLADDSSSVLEGLKKLLSHTNKIRVIGQALNGKEVIDFITDIEVDVIIMDANMPIMDGITCATIIKKECPGIKIIMLTMYTDKSYTDEILKIGVEGCLIKSQTKQELQAAIHSVISGEQYYGLIPTFEPSYEATKQFKLSDRELEIIRLITEGYTNSEIADKLHLTEHTVQTNYINILQRVEFSSTSQLMKYSASNQLLS